MKLGGVWGHSRNVVLSGGTVRQAKPIPKYGGSVVFHVYAIYLQPVSGMAVTRFCPRLR
jgi:hypothetical protein